MSRKRLQTSSSTGGMSRRDFNKWFAASGIGLMSMNMVTGRANAANGDLLAVEWPTYHVPEILGAYMKKYGALPPISAMTSNEDALQKIISGALPVDVSHPDTYDIPRWRAADVLRPIDESRLSNWPDVFEAIKKVPHVYSDGKLWIVPAAFGNTSIVYRTDLVDAADVADPSWRLLWNKKYAGKVSMRGSSATSVQVAGLLNGVTDIWNMNDEQIAAAADLMREQRENNRFYWNDNASMEQALASGEVVAAMGWNASVASLKSQGIPVAMLKPKEGIFTWLDGIVWAKTGEGPEEKVYDLMDAWIDVAAGKHLIEKVGYGHSNRKSYDGVPASRLEEVGLSDPTGVLASGLFGSVSEESRAKIVKVYDEIMSGF